MDPHTAYQRRWQILAILCLSLILIGLDTLVLNLALPRIQQSLGASTSVLQWVVDSYALAFGGLLLFAGGLADRFGRKRLLLTGLAVFGGVSLGAAFVTDGTELIVCRVAMGTGAAMMMPATLAIIKDIFPVSEQGKAISVWSGAAAAGVPLGPVISGLLIQHFWWGSVFLINVPLAVLALAGVGVLVPESRDPGHPGLDVPGALLSVAGLTVLVYGLVEAPQHGWSSPVTMTGLAVGIVLLAAFCRWEFRSRSPMLPVDLFRKRRYAGGALATLCVSFGLYSMLFLLTQYLQSVVRLDPQSAGLRMLAVATIMVGAPLSPRLVERFGLKAAVVVGLVLCAAGLTTMTALTISAEALALSGLAVFGLGMGIALPAAVDGILIESAGQQAGAESAVADVAMQIGGSLGIAVIGSVAAILYHSGLPAGAPAVAVSSVGSAVSAAQRLGGPLGARLAAAAQESFTSGFAGAIWVAVAVAALGAVASGVILPRSRVAEVRPESAEAEAPAARH